MLQTRCQLRHPQRNLPNASYRSRIESPIIRITQYRPLFTGYMNIPSDAIIPSAKLNRYLLVKQVRNDKSKFLAQAGFTVNNYTELEEALRELISTTKAIEDRTEEYGTYYQVTGLLRGLNGIDLDVVTIWLERKIDQQFQFVTLLPDKKSSER